MFVIYFSLSWCMRDCQIYILFVSLRNDLFTIFDLLYFIYLFCYLFVVWIILLLLSFFSLSIFFLYYFFGHFYLFSSHFCLFFLWDKIIDVSTLLQTFLHLYQKVHAIDNALHKFHFGETESVWIGDIEDATLSCSVNATGTTFLKLRERDK